MTATFDPADLVERDAFVVGAGPNGLAAAITLARAGRSVTVLEAESTIGGGCRTAELTLPGFRHDVCSAIHPMARSSPAFAGVPFERLGVRWIEPEVQLGHPLDDGSVGLVFRDVATTAARLGPDAPAYRGLFEPLARRWPDIVDQFLGPFRVPLRPDRIALGVRFGLVAIQSTTLLARRFRTPQARALLAGVAAHSMLRLDEPASAAYGLALLTSAHAVGWPIVGGGSGMLAEALGAYLRELGGEIVTGCRVDDVERLPRHTVALLDLVPRGILGIAGGRFATSASGRRYAGALRRYRYGPGVFKLDIALDGPVPWRNPELLSAGTVHIGGTLEEIAAAETSVRGGRPAERPFVLVAQQSLFDPSRAPAGRQTLWAYCHVPNGSSADMTEPILRQVERYAPGFRDRILAIHAMDPAAIEAHDANYVGGDINGGLENLAQLFTRPAVRLNPYSTPDPSLFVCSSATPPGGGVHGISGMYAARSALRDALR